MSGDIKMLCFPQNKVNHMTAEWKIHHYTVLLISYLKKYKFLVNVYCLCYSNINKLLDTYQLMQHSFHIVWTFMVILCHLCFNINYILGSIQTCTFILTELRF